MKLERHPKLERIAGGWSVRLRCGKGQNPRFVIRLAGQSDALARAVKMSELARVLVRAGLTAEAPVILREAGEQATDAGFREVDAYARELCAEASKPGGRRQLAKRVPTFREFGESWTSGRLHKLYPDQVPLKDTAADDASRLRAHVYPTIGDKRIDQVTLDDCEHITRSIPEGASRSRRHIAGTIARVFRMAVYPCRHVATSPLPRGFLPRANSRKALTYLYPANDRALLACADVPFGYRLLWGFLAREGMREGEALALTWECADLVRGMVRLDENKTDDPRAWALNPGVARALRVYRQHFAPEAASTDPVFVQRSKFGLAKTFRLHLERASIKAERPELFVTTATRQRIRVHDLRGTFVTLALANGRPESWVMARTGHRSSQMVNRYRRIAMSFAELNLGELDPLDQAIPELAQLALLDGVRREVRQDNSADGANEMISQENRKRPQRDSNPGAGVTQAAQIAKNRSIPCAASAASDTSEHSGAPPAHVVAPDYDPIESATADTLGRLSRALEAAAVAGQWAVVRRLTDAMERLQGAARTDAEVLELDAFRGKRGGQ